MDPIANMLTSLKNAYSQQKKKIVVPASKHKAELCQLLKKQGYIADFKLDKKTPNIKIGLNYPAGAPAINSVRRISKPSRRFYAKAKNIPRPVAAQGTIFLSTHQGVMNHLQARKKNLGGEIICEVS